MAAPVFRSRLGYAAVRERLRTLEIERLALLRQYPELIHQAAIAWSVAAAPLMTARRAGRSRGHGREVRYSRR